MFDREAGIPTRNDSVFSTGSLTKQFTAAAIVRLADEGKLSIDDKARTFLPELDARFDAITIRHLLHHTSGVREYVTQLTSVTAPKTRQEVFAMITGTGPLFPAGSRFDYNNSGYYLLGVIIERASGQTYQQYLGDTFFMPMGLGSTSVSGETAPPPRGYTVSPGGAVTLDSVVDPSLLYANGSVCSTASDLTVRLIFRCSCSQIRRRDWSRVWQKCYRRSKTSWTSATLSSRRHGAVCKPLPSGSI